MIRFSLYRPRESWRDYRLTCGEYVLHYEAGYENGYAILAKRLRDAGMPDQPVEIVEDGPNGLRQELPSLFRLAECDPGRTRDEAQQAASAPGTGGTRMAMDSPSVRSALRKLVESPDAWSEIAGPVKGALRGYALFVDGAVTEAGHALLASPEPEPVVKQEGPALTDAQAQAIRALLANPGAWKKLHHATRASLERAGFVEVEDDRASVTDTALALLA